MSAVEPDEAGQEQGIQVQPQFLIPALEAELNEANRQLVEARRNLTVMTAFATQQQEVLNKQNEMIQKMELALVAQQNGSEPKEMVDASTSS